MHETSTPPIKVHVRRSFLTGKQEDEDSYELGVLVSARSIPGSVMLFQVLLENGILRDKLPIHAITQDPVAHGVPFHHLQLWNCFSANFSIVEIQYLSGLRVDVLLKDGTWAEGNYLWTFQWGPDLTHGVDLTLAIDPTEHKSGHFIALKNGAFAIQPNNRLRWHEPSHVTKPFPERPDHVVNTGWWDAETHEKWTTEDSDRWAYATKSEGVAAQMTPLDVSRALIEEEAALQEMTQLPEERSIPESLYGNPEKRNDPHGVFVKDPTQRIVPIPEEMLPLPDAPEGKKWVGRGRFDLQEYEAERGRCVYYFEHRVWEPTHMFSTGGFHIELIDA
jgi:hypothetical protein